MSDEFNRGNIICDIRTKDGAGLHPSDLDDIYKLLRQWAIRAINNNEININRQNAATVSGNNNNNQNNHLPVVQVDHYAQLFELMDNHHNNNNVNNLPHVDEAAANVDNNIFVNQYVDAEILMYRNVPKMPRLIRDNTGAIVIYNPLLWWSQNESKFPVIAHIARKVLCVPATSAPVERLFSHAGLTIANDRARLLPDMAEDLVFLHDAWELVDELILEL